MNGRSTGEKKRLIFVCTGNFYRSRLAELLFNHYAAGPELPWIACSRGLVVNGQLKGLSAEARNYAVSAGLDDAAQRNPRPLLVDELAAADLVVLMNRTEHVPLIERDFRPVYRSLLSRGAVRTWNVFDLAPPRMSWGAEPPPSQPAASATEHINFAVRALVAELAQNPQGSQS